MDVHAIMAKKIPAPWKPILDTDVFDVSNFDREFTQEDLKDTEIFAG